MSSNSHIPGAVATACQKRPPLDEQLEYVRARDASLHAWVHLPASIAVHENVPSDPRPLEGVPFGVKDVLDVRGMPTRCGSEYFGHEPAARDAACVATLREAGAIPLGKTHTAEFAYRRPAPTHNPVAPGHTPGGSSSGSAAAVAAGMVPFSLSTQTGGSIIRPAAYCGTVGFKPSFGLISRSGLAPGCESLDTIGWHATDLRTAYHVARVLMSSDSGAEEVAPAPAQSLRVLRIDSPGAETPHEEVTANLQRTCEVLRWHGATILEQTKAHSVTLDRLLEAHKIIMHYELSRSLQPMVVRHPSVSSPVRELLRAGRSVCRSEYMKALALQAYERQSWDSFTGGADIILSPSAPTAAGIGLEDSGSSAFCRAWTLLGWPCLHIPIGVSPAGLPLGLQIITPWQADLAAFRAAKLIWQINAHQRSSTIQ